MRSRLGDVFRWAETQGLIEAGRNPVAANRAHKVTVARECMSLEQFLAVREHAPVWLRNAMNLAIVTGQRREDILSMKFVNWRDERLHVAQGKSGGKTRLAIAGTVRLAKVGLSLADVVKQCRGFDRQPVPRASRSAGGEGAAGAPNRAHQFRQGIRLSARESRDRGAGG
jgi:integrase